MAPLNPIISALIVIWVGSFCYTYVWFEKVNHIYEQWLNATNASRSAANLPLLEYDENAEALKGFFAAIADRCQLAGYLLLTAPVALWGMLTPEIRQWIYELRVNDAYEDYPSVSKDEIRALVHAYELLET